MRKGEHRGDLVALAAATAICAAPVVIVVLATAAAGLVARGHPIGLDLGQAVRVLVRLPRTLAAPELAWPRQLRAGLPRAAVLDLILVVSTVAVLGVLAALLAVVVRHGRRDSESGVARWASRGELAELRVSAPAVGRITLGEVGGRLLAAERRVSVLGVGPAQSGKSTGLIVPAILEWQGPVLSTSIKADVVHDTHTARARVGEVLVFDPTASSGLPHAAWSPIGAAASFERARRTAASLLGVGDHSAARNADESFWRPAGARFLAPLLLAANIGDRTMGDVLDWIATTEEEQPTELLTSSRVAGAAAGMVALRSVWKADPRLRSNLTQTVATALDAWQEPALATATAGENEITAARLLDGPNTLYLVAPAHDQRRLRGLFTALVADVTAGVFERSARTGQPIDPPLLLALDEAANIAPLPNLDEIASTGPGQGVQLLTILQNLSQAADRWGHDRAQTIIANHRARIFTSGIGDQATLDYLQRTLGEEEIHRVATHRAGPLTTGSRTYSSDFRTLAAPNRIRQAHTNTALLVYGRLAPAWIQLRPWYANRTLRALIAGTPTRARRPRLLARARRTTSESVIEETPGR